MNHFEFYKLDTSFDRTKFDCGSTKLNHFLQTKARQNQSAGFNKTFIAINSSDKNKIVLGYYSLSMGEVDLSELPQVLLKKLPKHPVLVARMGRLAVDNKSQGLGLGKLLLVDAMKLIQKAAESIGVYALLVDAKDETAQEFYLKYGFIPLASEELTLFLPLASFPK